MIEIDLPDGSIVEFPEGTPDEEIERVLQEQAAPKRELSRFESGLLGFAQGRSLGLGDEALSAISAAGAKGLDYLGVDKLLTGKEYKKGLGGAFESQQAINQQTLQRAFEDNPVSFTAGSLAGGLKTGQNFAATAPGRAVASQVASGSLLSRAAKSAVTAGTTGAIAGFGTAGGDIEERLEAAPQAAGISAVMGAAGPYVGAGVNKLRQPKLPSMTSDQVRSEASRAYQRADELGGVLKKNVTNTFVDKAQKIKPQTRAGKLLAGDDDFAKIADRIEGLRNSNLTLAEAQEIDEFLGDMVSKNTDMGRLTKQGQKLYDLQTAFREIIDTADEASVVGGKEGFEALRQGRALWSQSIKTRDIERIIERAYMTDNPATAIKSGFRTLANNPKRMRGFTAEEKELIKRAARTGQVTDILRTLGSRLLPIISLASGGGFGPTAAAQAGSMAARSMASRMQINRAEEVLRQISREVMQRTNPRLIQEIAAQSPSLPGMAPAIGTGAMVGVAQ